MKKGVFWFILPSVLAVLFIVSLVSAQSIGQDLSSFTNSFIDFFEPIFNLLLGGNATNTGDNLFAKFLLGLIMFSVVYASLSSSSFFSNQQWVLNLISFAVSLLSIRLIGDDGWLQTILLPYNAIGIAVTAGLPFVLYFMFVRKIETKIGRYAAWIFFMVIFTGLWVTRYQEIPGRAEWIYPVTILGVILMMVFDSAFGWFGGELRSQRLKGRLKGQGMLALQKQMADMQTVFNANPSGYVGVTPPGKKIAAGGVAAYTADVEFIRKQIVKLNA